MTITNTVEQSITRQTARLKALKKIKGVLDALSEADAAAVVNELGGKPTSWPAAEPGQ